MLLIGCGDQLDKDYPPVKGDRREVMKYYLDTYGSDPGQWKDENRVKQAYYRDMDNATASTE